MPGHDDSLVVALLEAARVPNGPSRGARRRLAAAVVLLACAAPAAAQTPAAGLDADSIVARAIARRQALLASFDHVSYDAYVKLTACDLGRPADSAQSVVYIGEKRSSVYWAHRRRYQETVVAERHTRLLGGGRGGAPRSLVAVDGILDVERGQVSLAPYAEGSTDGRFGRPRASSPGFVILSPLARTAPDHYAYRVLDTTIVAGGRAFRLAVIPRSNLLPLFVGTMTIADSTFDPVALDLGLNDAVQFTSVRSLRYAVRFAAAGGGRGMPTEIRLTGEVRPRVTLPGVPRTVAGVPVPGLPEQLAFEQVAHLGGWVFDSGAAPRGVGEYRIVVKDGADAPDSAAWATPPAVPLTPVEQVAWERADSAARNPPLLMRVGEGVGSAVGVVAGPGFFHYNRVDGYYFGASHDWQAGPAVLTTRVGYGTGSRIWQYRLGTAVTVDRERRLTIGGWWHDETVAHPTLISSRYNPTFRALFARVDPLDYYRERGLGATLGVKLLDLTRLDLAYDDARQTTLDTLPGFSFRSSRYPPRGNPPIADGHLRALSAVVSYDSRQFMRAGDRELRLPAPAWTRVALGAEIAAPSVVPSDFSYRRYTLQVERAQPVPGFGTTTVSAAGGIATGRVPPQRYFLVDFGMDFLAVEGSGFTTLDRTNYYGTRAAVLTVRHEFGRSLFARSGLVLIRRLPVTLSLDGGVFWTAFVSHPAYPSDTALATAPRPYTEAGFSLGNLTPFLSPFNLSVHFAWQLSSYPTRRFRFGIGITGP